MQLGEDPIGRGGPDEGLGRAIVPGDEGVDAVGQLADIPEGPATDRLLGDEAKPALDLVEPRCTSG